MLYAIVALLVIILDQWTKFWVAGNIVMNTGSKELIPGIVSLVNLHNDGAAFSFLSGSNGRIYFIGIALVFALFVIIALATNLIKGQVGRWSAVFVMAGGIGNCIDRILYGFVQDMFQLEFLKAFPIFNVADIFITVFCFVFILYILFGGGRKASREDDEDDEDEEDEEEEEEEPEEKKKPARGRKKAAKAKKALAAEDEDDEDDEEDNEEEDDAPVRRPLRRKEQPARAEKAEKAEKAKKSRPRYEQEYEQFKAARAARQQEQPERPAPTVDPNDPFAEWEQRMGQARTARSQAAETEQKKAAPAPRVQEAPVAPAAADKQEPAAKTEEFSLDDILAEFR